MGLFTKNKTYIDERGYLRFKDTNRLVHRWVMEKYLGIKLRQHQIVHHINGNKLDNRPENLRVILEPSSWELHNNIHNKQKRETGNWYGKNKCQDCGTRNDSDFTYCKKCGKFL